MAENSDDLDFGTILNQNIDSMHAENIVDSIELDFDNLPQPYGAKDVYYIDSGYNYVFNSANLKVLYFKTAYVKLCGKNTFTIQVDRYALFLNDIDNELKVELYKMIGNLSYDIRLSKIPLDFNADRYLSMLDKEITNTMLKADLRTSIMIDMTRRFLELSMAKNIAEMDTDALLVLDGQIIPYYDFERSIIEGILDKNYFFMGLSKKSEEVKLLKKPGYKELSKDDAKIKTVLAKLHNDAKHCFRVDFSSRLNINDVLSMLHNQGDKLFIGYPYGLILVDKLAKVSEQEKQLFSQIAFFNCENKEKYQELTNQANPHDIIDKINKR